MTDYTPNNNPNKTHEGSALFYATALVGGLVFASSVACAVYAINQFLSSPNTPEQTSRETTPSALEESAR